MRLRYLVVIKMDFIATDKILQMRPDTMKCVRKMYNLDNPLKLEEAIDIFYEWIQKQSHFNKKDFSRHLLEVGLIGNKGSIERAKRQLDCMCTIRTLVPHFFGNYNPKSDFKNLYDIARSVVLPKLTEDHYRVNVLKFYDIDWKPSQTIDFYRHNIILAEYLKAHDYLHGYIQIIDFSEASLLSYLTKLNPVELRQAVNVFIEGYGLRLKRIQVISKSKVVDGLVTLLKQVLSPKLANRIIVHKSFEDLHEFIPKDVLPSNYGGEERSLESLHEEWINLLSSDEHLSYMREINKATTNESCRQRHQFSEYYAGMPGTFRFLNVD